MAKIRGSDGLFVAQAVTSLSLINLMIFPLSSLLLAIPDTFASMGCLDRIQGFLRHSKRLGSYPILLYFLSLIKPFLLQNLRDRLMTFIVQIKGHINHYRSNLRCALALHQTLR